ncbi:MAG: HAD family phosphatase [Anaerolineales bacterium]|nr:HAD family phosphatase [Anaerolineales bacterium]
MTLKAVYFDFGGVIARTEFQAPRQHLAERLGLEYEDLLRIIFDSKTAAQATVGKIDEEEHWAATLKALNLPADGRQALVDEFFGGDVVDRQLITYMRSLRPQYKVGLISNAWSGLRGYIASQGFADAFDHMIISAEVGLAKPGAAIFELALEKLEVQPAEAVFLDDFAENIAGARSVGMQAIHFQQPETALAELEQILNQP